MWDDKRNTQLNSRGVPYLHTSTQPTPPQLLELPAHGWEGARAFSLYRAIRAAAPRTAMG